MYYIGILTEVFRFMTCEKTSDISQLLYAQLCMLFSTNHAHSG